MFLNLKEQYPNLKLGTYFHCADNIHYYERHFDLVEKILEASPNHSPRIILKAPLFSFENGEFALTSHAIEYLKEVEEIIADEEKFAAMKYNDWKKVLSQLIEITD
jgi:thymidylate synthase